MNNNLAVFGFEGHQVRCIGTPENPEWIAQDVCEVLEIKNVSDTLRRLDDDEKGIVLIDTLGGEQEVLAVNESGLYSLVLSSRKAVAKRFKRWLTHEVIPAIRKTGSYSIPEKPQPLPLAEKLNALEQMLSDMGINPVLLRQVKLDTVAKYNPELKDMAELGKKLLGAENPLESVGLTPTQLGAKLDPPLSARQVNAKLEDLGLQYRDRSGKKPIWQLTEAGHEYGQVYLATKDQWSGAQIHWQIQVLDLMGD
ncbi:BRO-N domain-containing protein [Laspinema palackyanum]|uniref:BRO-N domain-containing protein n=1 Tax=Laspinema palackyanum TaxID=3231601 RepID=UPI00345D70AE|nr:BRO family protein [Laspinema sp. D2c]